MLNDTTPSYCIYGCKWVWTRALYYIWQPSHAQRFHGPTHPCWRVIQRLPGEKMTLHFFALRAMPLLFIPLWFFTLCPCWTEESNNRSSNEVGKRFRCHELMVEVQYIVVNNTVNAMLVLTFYAYFTVQSVYSLPLNNKVTQFEKYLKLPKLIKQNNVRNKICISFSILSTIFHIFGTWQMAYMGDAT